MSNMSNALAVITGDIYATRDAFESVLSDRSINFEREAGFAIQIITSSDYAMGIASNNRQSVVNAVTNVAAIGLSLNPAKKHAYLVPRDGKICLDISYMGLVELAIATGSIMWAQAVVVYAQDGFQMQGLDKPPVHNFNPFSKERGEIVGVYVTVKTSAGDYLTEVMSSDEINSIRDRSSAWKAWISKQKKCPWVTDWSEMARKTVVKRASKYWPKTDRLDSATHYLNTDGGEGLADVSNAPQVVQAQGFDATAWIVKARATKTEPDLTKVYGEAMAAAAAAKDREGAAKFKEAALAHRAVLRNAADGNTIDV